MKLKNSNNITDWGVTAAVVVICGILVHIFYPYPFTISDSFGYIFAALEKQFSVFRPTGYSVFLRLIHFFSHNISAVHILQSLLYIICCSIFSITIKKYYPVSDKRWPGILFTAVVAFCPTVLLMLNAIMSDGLFCCMILLCIAMMVKLLNEPSYPALFVYAIAFYILLFTRYSAMFFPIAFIPILFFIKKKSIKWLSVALTVISLFVFYDNVKTDIHKTVGLNQFSTGFDGWQLANNAMHVLPFIEDDEIKWPKDKNTQALHNLSLRNFDKLILEATGNGHNVCASFLWDNRFPLKLYLYAYMDSNKDYYQRAWAKLGGGLYSDYGKWLILQYPGKFFKYYLAPNIKSALLAPPAEILSSYSTVAAGKDEIVKWFGFPSEEPLSARNDILSKGVHKTLNVFELIDWVILIAAFVFGGISLRRGRKTNTTLWLLLVFGLLYYGTTIFATPVAIRYWMPMHAVKLAYAWIVLSEISKPKPDAIKQ